MPTRPAACLLSEIDRHQFPRAPFLSAPRTEGSWRADYTRGVVSESVAAYNFNMAAVPCLAPSPPGLPPSLPPSPPKIPGGGLDPDDGMLLASLPFNLILFGAFSAIYVVLHTLFFDQYYKNPMGRTPRRQESPNACRGCSCSAAPEIRLLCGAGAQIVAQRRHRRQAAGAKTPSCPCGLCGA